MYEPGEEVIDMVSDFRYTYTRFFSFLLPALIVRVGDIRF